MDQHIFISHSTQNDDIAKKLREFLESGNFSTWVDSRQLTGGDILDETITEKITTARMFITLLSLEALRSEWVQKELKLAQQTAAKRNDGYKVIHHFTLRSI